MVRVTRIRGANKVGSLVRAARTRRANSNAARGTRTRVGANNKVIKVAMDRAVKATRISGANNSLVRAARISTVSSKVVKVAMDRAARAARTSGASSNA